MTADSACVPTTKLVHLVGRIYRKNTTGAYRVKASEFLQANLNNRIQGDSFFTNNLTRGVSIS
jgi:hypothetical protein